MAEPGRTEFVLKVVSAVVAVSAFLFGIVQYTLNKRADFRSHFWDEQYSLYQEAAGAAAEIAMAPHIDSVVDARRRFWMLYWGKLAMVEHPEVERAMNAFGKKLSKCESGADTTCFSILPGAQLTPLRESAYRLADCLRLSLSKTWEPVHLGPTSGCPLEFQDKK